MIYIWMQLIRCSLIHDQRNFSYFFVVQSHRNNNESFEWQLNFLAIFEKSFQKCERIKIHTIGKTCCVLSLIYVSQTDLLLAPWIALYGQPYNQFLYYKHTLIVILTVFRHRIKTISKNKNRSRIQSHPATYSTLQWSISIISLVGDFQFVYIRLLSLW